MYYVYVYHDKLGWVVADEWEHGDEALVQQGFLESQGTKVKVEYSEEKI